jgi:hypothetical protein
MRDLISTPSLNGLIIARNAVKLQVETTSDAAEEIAAERGTPIG